MLTFISVFAILWVFLHRLDCDIKVSVERGPYCHVGHCFIDSFSTGPNNFASNVFLFKVFNVNLLTKTRLLFSWWTLLHLCRHHHHQYHYHHHHMKYSIPTCIPKSYSLIFHLNMPPAKTQPYRQQCRVLIFAGLPDFGPKPGLQRTMTWLPCHTPMRATGAPVHLRHSTPVPSTHHWLIVLNSPMLKWFPQRLKNVPVTNSYTLWAYSPLCYA